MKDYNWREEREKFRPDFQTKKETPPPAEPPKDDLPKESDSRKTIAVIAGLAAIALIVVGCCLFLPDKNADAAAKEQTDQKKTVADAEEKDADQKKTVADAEKKNVAQDSATMLANAAAKYKNAVGLVTVTFEMKSGRKLTQPIGTAWAFDENKFATNAHVAKGIGECVGSTKRQLVQLVLSEHVKAEKVKNLDELERKIGTEKFRLLVNEAAARVQSEIKEISASIVINGTYGKSYNITKFQMHKNYGIVNSSFDPDVAVLTIQGKHDTFFKIAGQTGLHALRAGDPVAFLGFPMENLMRGNVNVTNPVASMQTGSIVAVTDFDLKDAGENGNLLIRHNLPAAGGASGSPIFNKNGEVVALLYAGNIIRQSDGSRAPSAAMINLAVRADLIEGMGSIRGVSELLK